MGSKQPWIETDMPEAERVMEDATLQDEDPLETHIRMQTVPMAPPAHTPGFQLYSAGSAAYVIAIRKARQIVDSTITKRLPDIQKALDEWTEPDRPRYLFLDDDPIVTLIDDYEFGGYIQNTYGLEWRDGGLFALP